MQLTITYIGKLFDAHKSALEWNGKEKSAWFLCNRSRSCENVKLLPRELIIPSEADYVRREPGYYEVRKRFINKVIRKAVEGQYHILQSHIHPSGIDTFSSLDEQREIELMRHLNSKISGMYHASIVFSNDFNAIDGWFYDEDIDSLTRIQKVVVVRQNKLEVMIPEPVKDTTSSTPRSLARSIKALGKKAVDDLRSLHVGVVGASALGGPICEFLSRDKVRAITICDPDRIDQTNLNRLIWATDSDVGKSKAEFYGQVIKKISPETEVNILKKSFYDSQAQDEFSSADIIFGCVDSGARLSINRLANANNIPYFDLGAGIEIVDGKPEQIGGQVYCIIPESRVCLSCSGAFDMFLPEYMPEPERQREIRQGYLSDPRHRSIVLIQSLDMIVAGLGYNLMLKYISGMERVMPFQVSYDGNANKMTSAECDQVGCITCSDDGFLGGGNKVPGMVPRKTEFEGKERRCLFNGNVKTGTK
jgi:molybdopterin-synthase adenylyltransferase